MLKESDKVLIKKRLKQRCYQAFNDVIYTAKLKIIEQAQLDKSVLDAWYVPEIMTNRDMLYELDLLGFVESG